MTACPRIDSCGSSGCRGRGRSVLALRAGLGQPPIRLDEGDLHGARLVVIPRGIGVERSVQEEGVTYAAIVRYLQVGSRPGSMERESGPPIPVFVELPVDRTVL